jgi:hypothetical protein
MRGIDEARARSLPEEETLKLVHDLVKRMSSEDPTLAERIIEAAGGTSAGVQEYIRQVDPLYDEADALMKLPYDQFLTAIKAFNEQVNNHPNLLVHVFFPLFENCRLKQFAVEVRSAMLEAAVAYRENGPAGLETVLDPVGQKPFEFRRFVLDGLDRGFELRSTMEARGWVEALIFVERDGRPFRVEGKHAGRPG